MKIFTHEQIIHWLISEKNKSLEKAKKDLKMATHWYGFPPDNIDEESERRQVYLLDEQINLLKYILDLFEEYTVSKIQKYPQFLDGAVD